MGRSVATVLTSCPPPRVVDDWMWARYLGCCQSIPRFWEPLMLLDLLVLILSTGVQTAEACTPKRSAGEAKFRAT
jgi:hypothetical protein